MQRGKPTRVRTILQKNMKGNLPVNYGLRPTLPEHWKLLGEKLVRWAQEQTDETTTIDEFALQHGYPPYKFNNWGRLDEYFDECLDIAQRILGCRLTKGALKRELDPTTVFKILPFYNREYKEFLIQQKNDSADKVVRLLVQPIEDTGIPKFTKDED